MIRQKEIKSFMIPDKQFVMSVMAKFVTEKQIYNAVMENNERCDIYRDAAKMALIVNCENKPRDLPVYGLQWEAI